MRAGRLSDGARTGVSRLRAAALAGAIAAVSMVALAQTEPAGPSSETATPAVSPAEQYATFSHMAGQIADQLSRGLERLPGGPVDGLVGEGGFITDHLRMLDASREAIDSGVEIAEARREGHVRAVLTFLDQATRLTQLVNELENAETNGDGVRARTLRSEIAELSQSRLFEALAADAPARLVVTADQADGESVFWPRSIHSVEVAIENRGDAPARGVTARIEPLGSVVTDISSEEGSCASEAGDEAQPSPAWACERALLGPGERWRLAVAFRHAAPATVDTGPPAEVRVRVAASARSPALGDVATEARFAVANCSANYHLALVAMRANEAQRLLDRLGEARSGDRRLPRRWLARSVDWDDGEVAAMMRRAGNIVEARGADPWLTTQAGEGTVARVVYGLRGYVKQNFDPALCTGAGPVVESYRSLLDEFGRHRQMIGVDADRARALAVAAVDRFIALQGTDAGTEEASGGSGGEATIVTLDDTIGRFVEAVTGEPRPPREPAGGGDATGARYDAIAMLADTSLADIAHGDEALAAGREAFALIEAAFYFDTALARYAALAQAFDDTLAAIATASAAQCRCRPGNVAVPPTTAAVPVEGAEAPMRLQAPRPKAGP